MVVMAKRAISTEDKNKKKELILNGALQLLEEGRFPLPSVNEICAHIKEAKGTVYLYFKSKEEIYLTALILAFEAFVASLTERLENKKITTSAAVALTIKDFTEQQPKMAYLAVITPIVLEQNVSEEFIHAFKRGLLTMTTELAKRIHTKEGMSVNQARVHFLVSYNLFIGMWQHLNPAKSIQVIIEDNDLLDLQFDFYSTYKKMLDRIWQV
jgi:TetR/AcrR family transcriptional regulator